MNRDDLVGVAEGTILASALFALFFYLLIALNGNTLGTFVVMFGTPVVATAVLSALFVPKFRLAASTGVPSAVLTSVAYQLRIQGFRVEEAPGQITVRLGTTVALRVHARPSAGGSTVSYQAYATPAGWGTLVTLVILLWTAPAAIGAILYTFRKAHRFARDVVAHQVRNVEAGPTQRSQEETHALLVSGLSEGHRLAAEAYEAARSAYSDNLAVIGLLGLLAWGLVFAAFYGLAPGFVIANGALIPMAVAVLAGMGTITLLYLLLRRRTLPQLLHYKSWSARLQAAVSREAAHVAPEAAEPSSIELLMDASNRIPEWLAAKRRAGLTGDQAADWIVFILSFWAVWAYWFALWNLFQLVLLLGLSSLLGGAALSLGAFLIWKYWKRKEEAARTRVLEEWRRRAETLRSKLNRLLEEM